MKEFLSRSAIFASPLVILYILSLFFYSTEQGISRIGYITHYKDYTKTFEAELSKQIRYQNLYLVDTTCTSNFTVLTIGDSFSARESFCYNNYLAEYDSISVLHSPEWMTFNNPIQIIYGLLNSGLFDNLSIDYLVLESAERDFTERAQSLDKNKHININDLKEYSLENSLRIESEKKNRFEFSGAILKYPLYSFLYALKDNAFISKVYKVSITQPLFSGNREKQLLFYASDIASLNKNNNLNLVSNLNDVLNCLSKQLNQRGIKLIVVPAPDKYDIYFDYIENKDAYERPLFFDHLRSQEKEYIYIDTKLILSEAINNIKDVYFYDDSHWSPWGHQLIANELAKVINRDSLNKMDKHTELNSAFN